MRASLSYIFRCEFDAKLLLSIQDHIIDQANAADVDGGDDQRFRISNLFNSMHSFPIHDCNMIKPGKRFECDLPSDDLVSVESFRSPFLNALTLPLVGVTGHVMEGATVDWAQGTERGLLIPVSSWDSFRNVTGYRLSPVTGERLSIGPVGLVAPTNSTVLNALPSSISIALSWAAISRASRYEIQTRADSGSDWTLLVSTASQTYTHFGLTSGTERDYRLRGINEAGNGPWSDPITVATSELAPQTAPVIRGDVSPSSYSFTINITTGVAGVEEYEYQRFAAGVWTTVGVTADTFITENLGAGVTRNYRARHSILSAAGHGQASSR